MYMNGKEIALGIFLLLFLASMTSLLLGEEEVEEEAVEAADTMLSSSGDPLFQYEGHDHSNATQTCCWHRQYGTSRLQLSFNARKC